MPRSTPKSTAASQPEVVSPIWLLKAVGCVLLAAILCGYLTLCLLFRMGQWQLVLHPAQIRTSPPASPEVVRFGLDESATPQLVGVWLPAAPAARYAGVTILFLPGGDGSRSDFDPTIDALHDLGLNVLAFDYRGYGFSADARPSQKKMTQDAESARRYLTTMRAIPPREIVPYGTGVGASLATQLALSHPEIPAVILDSPYADLLPVARRDPRTRLIPAMLLFRERFPLAEPLANLHIPKLLITKSDTPYGAFSAAPDPKITVELTAAPGPQFEQTVTRFLDEYLRPGTGQAMPFPAPSTTNSH